MAAILSEQWVVRKNHNRPIKIHRARTATVKIQAKPARKTSKLRKFLFASVILGFISLIGAGLTFRYFYSYYSYIVERRIASGFWHSRAGIYAAPHSLRSGQRITRDQVISLLRQAGFVEGDKADFYNGSYRAPTDSIEIYPNNSELAKVSIKFDKEKILSISDETDSLKSFEIEGEMLAGNSASKRDSTNALKYNQIPQILRDAIISTEDSRFFEHNGIDYKGILRAAYANLTHGAIKQGGSTITQQLVKNTFLSSEKTYQRKISEVFIALALESHMSKEDIFALYCNEVYFGQYGSIGIHGVEQASRSYFGKEINNLNISEAATIAAMIKSPSKYSPAKNYNESKMRRNLVIENLLANGKITKADADAALNSDISLVPPKSDASPIAPYFTDSVKKQLTDVVNADVLENDNNLRVYTTIDPQLQQMAEKSIAAQVNKLDKIYSKKGLTVQATLVSMNPKTGEILAMVGGRDYEASQFNRATDALRQPGSVFKPFVYASAIERGIMPNKVFADQPTSFSMPNAKDYQPANYGNSYAYKDISLKTALAKSSNVVALDVALETGLSNVARTARKFGFNIDGVYPSMALGTSEVTPIQLAAAYSSFANQGLKVKPTFFSKIISSEGKTIYESQSSGEQIVSPQTAYIVTDMLRAVVERGTARSANNALGKDVTFVGKTGSSKDGWFVGYTPNLVTVVWIGFDDNKDIGFTGGEVALPAWVDFMKQVVDSRPEYGGKNFVIPAGVTEITIDPETGMLAKSYCPTSEKMIVKTNMVPFGNCYKHQPVQDQTVIAQNAETELNQQTVYGVEYVNNTSEQDKTQPNSENSLSNSVNSIPANENKGNNAEERYSNIELNSKNQSGDKFEIKATIYEESEAQDKNSRQNPRRVEQR